MSASITSAETIVTDVATQLPAVVEVASDVETAVANTSSLEARIAAAEDAIQAILGAFEHLFPGHLASVPPAAPASK